MTPRPMPRQRERDTKCALNVAAAAAEVRAFYAAMSLAAKRAGACDAAEVDRCYDEWNAARDVVAKKLAAYARAIRASVKRSWNG